MTCQATGGYRVQRRKPGGERTDVSTSLEPSLRLNGQDAGVEFEYQVLAINKAGASPPSIGEGTRSRVVSILGAYIG